MELLITRPLAEARRVQEALQRLGHGALLAPLLEIVPRPAAGLCLDDLQAVLVTSANGARALAAAVARRDLWLFAVGEASGETARGLGFSQVVHAAGDVAALAALVAARLDPAAGPLLHVSGQETAGDLAGRLGALGFTMRRAVLYEARAATAFPEPVRTALAQGTLDGVLFYSPRTAHQFGVLAHAEGLAPAAARLDAYCLSPAVAAAAGALAWRACHVASHPREAALLALLDPARCT